MKIKNSLRLKAWLEKENSLLLPATSTYVTTNQGAGAIEDPRYVLRVLGCMQHALAGRIAVAGTGICHATVEAALISLSPRRPTAHFWQRTITVFLAPIIIIMDCVSG